MAFTKKADKTDVKTGLAGAINQRLFGKKKKKSAKKPTKFGA